MTERTLGLIKPNATKANLQEFILNDINNSAFDLSVIQTKDLTLTQEQAEAFYGEHKDKGFFGSLVDFMTSGPIVAFVIEGENAVKDYRTLLGNTDPQKADEGTLRAKYAQKKDANSAHGSDSIESAKREIDFFFSSLDF